jgi:hypothetical protein
MSRATAAHAAASAAAAGRTAGSRLASLRERIDAVRRQRAATRRTVALATLAIAIVTIAVGVFLGDWLLALPKPARFALLVGAAGLLAWCYVKYVRPWLLVRESDLDLAILVEKQHGVDSDLVAALQFDSPRSAEWGSGSLRGAVIDYVAEFSREWRVPSQVAHAAVRSRLGVLGALVACLIAGVVARPDFARVFINRVLLGSMHYPTRTRIESLTIGGKPVDLGRGSAAVASSPIGQPVVFEVGLAGVIPEAGQVRLRSAGGPEADLDLRPDADQPAGAYSAKLPRLLESVEVEVLAGDAWTDPITLRVVPLPIVETELSATAPSYARDGDAGEPPPRGARQIAVLEGSQVSLGVTCGNKRLESATLVVDGAEHPLRPGGKDGQWTLPVEESPLSRIVQPVRFEVKVVDEDGLSPETPVTGSIRIKSDALPQVFADMQTRLTLPEAAPRLDWTVADDHGIRAVTLLVEPLPAQGAPGADAAAARPEPRTITVAEMPAAGWLGIESLPLKGSAAIALKSLGLKKGDQVRVTLQATDYRGESEGRTISSDPIVVDVTDEPGLLASLYESDERGARQLEAILERQLQTGSLPQFRPGRQAGSDSPAPAPVPVDGGSP